VFRKLNALALFSVPLLRGNRTLRIGFEQLEHYERLFAGRLVALFENLCDALML
jgi:hypothetical protein